MRHHLVARESRAAVLAAAVTVALAAGTLPHDAALAGAPEEVIFRYTGAAQTWTVPSGVYQATFDLLGAAGGEWHSDAMLGKGARVQATIAVTPGEVLQVNVGGKGGRRLDWTTSSVAGAGLGGWNGGGDGGRAPGTGDNAYDRAGGGGGATDVRRDPGGKYTLADRILVAGGGGGNGHQHDHGADRFGIGGDAGDATGSDGQDGRPPGSTNCFFIEGGAVDYDRIPGQAAIGGAGGTRTAGGEGGKAGDPNGAYGSNHAGGDGTRGRGGDGGDGFGCAGGNPGGGGGGGWYGGGGGGAEGSDSGGGGGGSSFGPQDATITPGFNDGGGLAIVRFTPGDPPPTTHRPDGRIRLGTSGAFAGNDRYNTTGAGQTKSGSGARGSTITFGVSIQNDGDAKERFTVKAVGSARTGYAVRYLRGTTDITTAVVAGTYRTASLAPGAAELILVKVSIKRTAPVGSNVSRLVEARSPSGPKDVVRLTAKRS